MPASVQLISSQRTKNRKQQNKSRQQIDLYAVALELQTLSLLINDLRTRVSQIEKRLHAGEITEADRALLSNLDCIFEKRRPITQGDPSPVPSTALETPGAATRVLQLAEVVRMVNK